MGDLHDLQEVRKRKRALEAELAVEARMAARLAEVVTADPSEFLPYEDWRRENGLDDTDGQRQ